jgi:hypothetical protein
VVRLPTGARDFVSSAVSKYGLRTAQSHLFSPEINRLGRKAHCLLHSCLEVKNVWSYTSAHPYAFTECTGTALHLMLRVSWTLYSVVTIMTSGFMGGGDVCVSVYETVQCRIS